MPLPSLSQSFPLIQPLKSAKFLSAVEIGIKRSALKKKWELKSYNKKNNPKSKSIGKHNEVDTGLFSLVMNLLEKKMTFLKTTICALSRSINTAKDTRKVMLSAATVHPHCILIL